MARIAPGKKYQDPVESRARAHVPSEGDRRSLRPAVSSSRAGCRSASSRACERTPSRKPVGWHTVHHARGIYGPDGRIHRQVDSRSEPVIPTVRERSQGARGVEQLARWRHNSEPSGPFEALGDANRREILRLLGAGEKSVQEIAGELPISRPAVSRHLKVLAGAGLVSSDRAGNPAGVPPPGAGCPGRTGLPHQRLGRCRDAFSVDRREYRGRATDKDVR